MVILRDILKSRNSELHSKFLKIEKISRSIMPKSKIFFPTYTNHEALHLENVEEKINEIISEDIVEQLSDEEIFCLLSATWLHDVGMIPFNDELETFENKHKDEQEDFRNNIREKHHIRSSLYVDKHEKELNINDFETKAIGNICKGHRRYDLSKFEDVYYNNQIRVDSLSAILRLADECDISEARESCLSAEGINESIKNQHYKIHDIVSSVNINHEIKKIIIIANISKESDKKILTDSKNKIFQELSKIKPFLHKIGINLNDIILKTTPSSSFLKSRIILCIAENRDIYEIIDEFITNEDIYEGLEKLIIDNTIKNDSFELSEDFDKFKEIFELFEKNNNLEEFFFTDYVQNMISKCFFRLENNFNVDWELEDRKSRITLLKNSPTALYFLLFMDEIIKMPNFNISSNQNGVLMFDSILSFGLFNDIHHYASKINFNEVESAINKVKIFNRDYVLSRITAGRLLGDDNYGK